MKFGVNAQFAENITIGVSWNIVVRTLINLRVFLFTENLFFDLKP